MAPLVPSTRAPDRVPRVAHTSTRLEHSVSSAPLFVRQQVSGSSAPFGPSPLGSLVGPLSLLEMSVTFEGMQTREHLIVALPKNANITALVAAAVRQVRAEPHLDYACYLMDDTGQPKEALDGKKLLFRLAKTPLLVRRVHHAAQREVVLRIHLPEGQKHTVVVAPQSKVYTLLPEVCEKRKMDPAEHALLSTRGPVHRELTASDVASDDALLYIVPREGTREEDEGEIFWYRKLAEKYARYSVNSVERSKRSKREKLRACVLGIDGEHFTQTAMDRKRGSTQAPPLLIRAISSVALMGDRRVTIHLGDDTKRVYEAATPQLARTKAASYFYLLTR